MEKNSDRNLFFFSVLSKEENLDAEIKKGQDNNLEKKTSLK